MSVTPPSESVSPTPRSVSLRQRFSLSERFALSERFSGSDRSSLLDRLPPPGRFPGAHRLRRVLPLVFVGVAAGLIGAAYLGALHLLQHWLWPDRNPVAVQSLLLVGTGVVIALVTRWLGPGGDVELLVDNIHVLGGAETEKGDRALVPLSLLGISVGSTLGPEAPLVQTCGTMGSRVAQRLRLDPPEVRVLTLVGMAAGFTVLFGTPVGATIFALEVLHRRGLEYYEALVPALVGGLCGYGVFVVATNLGVRPVWHFDPVGSLQPADLLAAVIAGAAGTLVAAAFALLVRGMRRAVKRFPGWTLPVLGGAAMAALGWWSPYALTFGEFQVEDLLVPGLAVSSILVAITAKLAGAAACLTGRWKGGFIIPLFFCGAGVGQILAGTLGWSTETVFVTATMAAAVTGVLKTPLGSPLVVSGMSGLSMLPTSLIASIVSLSLSSRVNLIGSQRHRRDDPHSSAADTGLDEAGATDTPPGSTTGDTGTDTER